MIGRIITRGRNSGLKCLSTGSPTPPFPSLSSLFFPQTESLFTGYSPSFIFSNYFSPCVITSRSPQYPSLDTTFFTQLVGHKIARLNRKSFFYLNQHPHVHFPLRPISTKRNFALLSLSATPILNVNRNRITLMRF